MSRNDLPGPNAANFPQRLREAVMTYLGRTGDPLDRGITLRDLIEGGIARLRDGYTAGQAAASGGALPIAPEVVADEPDLTPPPTPTGFTASAAISHVFIEHDAPLYTQGHGHLRTRVYGKIVAAGDPLPVFADAVEITQFTGAVHAHPSNPSTTWRLWIKWESADGVLSVSPAGGTNGLQAVTGQDVSSMVAAMTGAGKPFTVLTAPTVIGGVTFPAGIYSTLAFIQDLQVTNGKIANLAVDDSKIADLSVEKLNGAQMKVGAFIQSTNYTSGASGNGWRINADGTAELQAAFIRGQLVASQINGNGLVIRDNSGNAIFGVGTNLDHTRIVASSGWLNSGISIGSNGALSGGGGGQVTIGGLGYTGDLNATRGAPAGTLVGSTAAETVEANASSALSGLAGKLNKSAADTLSGTLSIAAATGAGFRAGNLTWDSSGNRTGGAGVAMTPGGLVGHNGTKVTFSINAGNGNATFGGALDGASGSFAGTLTGAIVKAGNIEVGAVTAANASSTSLTVVYPTNGTGNSADVNGNSFSLTISGGAGAYLLVFLSGVLEANIRHFQWTNFACFARILVDGNNINDQLQELPLETSSVFSGVRGRIGFSASFRVTGIAAGSRTFRPQVTFIGQNAETGVSSGNNWPSGSWVGIQTNMVVVENKV